MLDFVEYVSSLGRYSGVGVSAVFHYPSSKVVTGRVEANRFRVTYTMSTCRPSHISPLGMRLRVRSLV